MLGFYGLGLGRGGAIALPTGFIVLTAVGLALFDVGDDLDLQARIRGEEVNHELSTGMQTATYAAAGVGLLVLLAGGAFALRALRDDDEDEVPLHRGGRPPAPAPPTEGQGIDIG